MNVEPPEIVVSDPPDHAAGLAEPAHLVDEDGRGARRKGSDQGEWFEEPVAALRRHDLDDDLPDGDDGFHAASTMAASSATRDTGAAKTSRL